MEILILFHLFSFQLHSQQFEKYVQEEDEDMKVIELRVFRDLSLRLAQSYGINIGSELKASIEQLIQEGVMFAFTQKGTDRYLFLSEGIIKFTSRLTPERALAL